jgi:hypothetical protein
MVKGKFEGIVRERTSEPHIRIIGTYDTVYYGTLSYFVLVVPEEAEIEQTPASDISDCIIVSTGGRKYYFKLEYGNAYFPDKLVPSGSCPEM